MKFDKSIHNIVYRENVFPTLGVRPLQSGINDMIKSNFANTLLHIQTNNIDCDAVEYSYKNKKITAYFSKNNMQKGYIDHPIILRLDSLRNSKNNDLQAMVAIHESGHAIMQILEFNRLPLTIMSVTADSNSKGFMLSGWEEDKLTNKNNVNQKLKVYLGGRAAETIIFGEDFVTTGSMGDLEDATELIMNTYRLWGMKGTLGSYTLSSDDDTLMQEHDWYLHQSCAESELLQIMQATVEQLRKYKPLLLQLGKYLSEHSSISQIKLKKLLEKYSDIDVSKLKSEHEKTNYGYKDKLNKLLG